MILKKETTLMLESTDSEKLLLPQLKQPPKQINMLMLKNRDQFRGKVTPYTPYKEITTHTSNGSAERNKWN
jgi:hypothetical protein